MRGALLEEAQGSDNPREIYSHEDYVSLVHHSGQVCCFIYEYIMLVYLLFSVARKSEWTDCQILRSRRICPLGPFKYYVSTVGGGGLGFAYF